MSSEDFKTGEKNLKARFRLKKATLKEQLLRRILALQSTVMQLSGGVFIYFKEELDLGIVSSNLAINRKICIYARIQNTCTKKD